MERLPLKIAIFALITIVNVLLARFAALSISNIPGIVTFYFAVPFMIVFALWFGAWGAIAAYVGCVVGAGISAGLPVSMNLFWSLADLWQVLIPLLAFKILKADVSLRKKSDLAIFLLFGLFLNNLVGASWGSSLLVMSGQVSPVDFSGVFSNWFFGNLIVTILITPLLLRYLTSNIKKSGILFDGY